MKIIFLFVVLITSITLFAQPGTLDKNFGENGKVTTNFGDGTAPEISKAILQADNKIVEVGNYNSDIIEEPQGFLIVRYKDNGTLDSSYGTGGKTVIKFSFEDQSFIKDAVVQNDNKILLAGLGWSDFIHPVYSGIIARLSSNGILDSSFGVDGAIQISSKGQGGFSAIALVSDNKFVAVGGVGDSSFIVRYLENGLIDQTFGQNGYAFIPNYFEVFSCKIQTDGKIVISGYDGHIGFPKFCIQRFLPDGKVDNSFGNNGTVITNYGGDENQIHDLAFQSDGKIIVTGETTTYSLNETNFATARYNTDGTLDSAFGTNGKYTTVFTGAVSSANSIIVLKDDRILIGGIQAIQTSNFAMTMLTKSGFPDSIFGGTGEVITDFGYASYLQSVLLQSNGKIVAAGGSGQQPPFYCSLARYNNDESQKQIIITKIKRWIQHHNGIEWNNMPGVQSYAVQRSMDGIHWTTVYRSQVTAYSAHYSDPTPSSAGTNYYRLQTTSISNAVANSNVIAITNDDLNITLSPNPAKSTLSITGLPTNEKLKITVVDFSGNTAMSHELSPVPPNAGATSASYDLNISSLHAGNYVLKVETNGEMVTRQFVKE